MISFFLYYLIYFADIKIMDNNSIATLQDYQSSIEYIFKKMEKNFKEFDGADTSQQNLALNSLNQESVNVKTNIGLMNMELSNLKEEGNINQWQNIISELQAKNDKFRDDITAMKNKKNNAESADYLDVDGNPDLSKMTSQQVMDRGDNILASDRDAINRIKSTVSQDLNTMKDVNKELNRQNESLENANKDLKEIDYSLNRAGQQIKTMVKIYATDKIVICMIAVIILIIVGILIFTAFGGDDEEDSNQKQDSFNNGNKSSFSTFINSYSLVVFLLNILLNL